jgi:predicted RNA binding protein YcfA (HicA-like mRNA interferase family)
VSARLPSLSAKALCRVLERKGWELARTKGSHRIYVHPVNPRPISVPMHPGDLKRPLVAGVLKDAGVTREELRRLL